MLLTTGDSAERVASAPQTVRRAITVLDVLATAPQGLGLKHLSESLHLTRSTTHRLVSGLILGGLVELCPETRRYRLGMKLLELSAVLLDSLDVREQSKPFMQRLNELSRETVHLGVLDHWDVVFIGHIESPESVRMSARVGRRSPAYCTSLGKVLLAWLEESELQGYLAGRDMVAMTPRTITDADRLLDALREVRRRGYAVDDEENREGVRCLGAPVRDHTGRVVAAVSVSGPSFRLTSERAEDLVEPLLQAAAGISERMGWRGARRP